MSVRRANAVVNQQLDLRFELRFDRTGDLFDADSVTKVEILDSDHSTVLETIASVNVTKLSLGTYQVVTSASWNTTSRLVYDRWTFVIDGVTVLLESSAYILDTAAPSIGMASFVSLVKLKAQAPTAGQVFLTDPDDYETLIEEAIKEYSERRPYQKTVKLTGDGGRTVSLPSDFEVGFSIIPRKGIEYPLDTFPPIYLERKDYSVDQLDTGWVIRFITYAFPGNAEEFYLRYTIRHSVTASASTVPVTDKDAVCNLAASLCCQALAEKYGHTAESSLDADVVAYRTRGDEFSSRAKELRKLYDNKIKSEINSIQGEFDMPSFWESNRDHFNRRNTHI